MSDDKDQTAYYCGLMYRGGRFQRNCVPAEYRTETVTPIQLDLLTRFIGFSLPKNREPNLPTPHLSWLEGYQAGFQAASENHRKRDHLRESGRGTGLSEPNNGAQTLSTDTQSAIHAEKNCSLKIPSSTGQNPADSSSTGCSKSVTKSNNETAAPALHSGPVAPVDQPVVDLLKTLPIDELRTLQKQIVPEDLISDLCGHASDELRRRRQQ